MASAIVAGEVDRISGNGNAILKTESQMYNLGPLPHKIVGNPVLAVPFDTTWAVCLTPYINRERYFSKFCLTTSHSKEEVNQIVDQPEQSVDSPVKLLSDQVIDEYSDLPDEPIDVGNTLEVQITARGPDASYVFFADGTAIEVNVPYLPAKTTIKVKIVDKSGWFTRATLADSILEHAPEPGTELTIEVKERDSSTAYSIQDGVPIILPGSSVPIGDKVHVGVESVQKQGLIASLTALPTDTRPTEGDILELELELRPSEYTTLVHEGLPIEITPPAFPMEGTLPLKITEVRKNAVSAHIDFTSYTGLSEGTQITVDGLNRDGEFLVGRYEGDPVTIPINGEMPKIPRSLPVTVTELRPDRIAASIVPCPEIESLEEGSVIKVPIQDRHNDYLIGDYEGYPVWIPFDNPLQVSALTVEVSDVTASGISASIPELPETAFDGEIMPVQVEKVHSDSISASLTVSRDGVLYTLPVLIPVRLDVSGEIGVEIIDQKKAYLIAIVRTLETGDDVEPIPVYIQKAQQALLALREKRFKDAAAAWQAAAESTETDMRRVEALRSWAFAAAESVITEHDVDDLDDTYFEYFHTELESLEVPDAYRSLTSSEVDIYRELVSVTIDTVPESVKGLQRIAYTIDERGRVNSIVSRLRMDVLEPHEDGGTADWKPRTPHPLFVYRLRRLCEVFESPPESARPLLRETPALETSPWEMPPESTPEPTPSETIDVSSGVSEASVTAATDTEDTADNAEKNATDETEEANDTPSTVERTSSAKTDEELPEDAEKDKQTTIGSDSGSTDSANPVESEDSTGDSDTDLSSEKEGSTEEIGRERPEELVTDQDIPQTTRQLEELRRKAEASASANPVRDTSSTGGGSRYQRASAIKEYVKARAEGTCEACGEPAPFSDKDDEPYLETHHVDELGKGGEDHPDKVVAVCPTCHKRIHYGEGGEELNKALRDRLNSGLADVGIR